MRRSSFSVVMSTRLIEAPPELITNAMPDAAAGLAPRISSGRRTRKSIVASRFQRILGPRVCWVDGKARGGDGKGDDTMRRELKRGDIRQDWDDRRDWDDGMVASLVCIGRGSGWDRRVPTPPHPRPARLALQQA